MSLVFRPRARIPRLPIAVALGLWLGGTLLAALALVFGVTLYVGATNTADLLRDKTRLISASIVDRTVGFLEPTVVQINHLAEQIESGDWQPADDERSRDILKTAVASLAQIESVAFVGTASPVLSGSRFVAPSGSIEIRFDARPVVANDRVTVALIEAGERTRSEAYWGAPIYVPALGNTVLNLRRPIWRDGVFQGVLISTVTVEELSRFITSIATEPGQTTFILYDRNYVLAHPQLTRSRPEIGESRAMLRVDEVGDPILAQIWQPEERGRGLFVSDAHAREWNGQSYFFLYRSLDAYADAPWTVGSYFRADAIDSSVRRLLIAGAAALAVLLLTGVLLYVFGRRLSQPIENLAKAASHVRTLDLDHLPPLKRSRLREIDVATTTFGDMVVGLRAFGLYVPKGLIRRLIRLGDAGKLRSVERDVTVMFSDISGFTAMTETMPAEQTAAFLNRHFDLLAGAIEAEGGTVDKFVGDGIMAFWGAPELQPDHVQRAIRAAAAIARALAADDATGFPCPIHVRIGLSTGPAVVGNIGSTSRMNYTVVGDTVNAAQRLIELGRTVPRDGTASVILMTEATACGLPADLRSERLGRIQLRGRAGFVRVSRLLVEPV
ncbi:adenylate/guanylate cyclase domain-containing protein [Marinivivus vitaminiproducens]|uniref:adenylate/guanylate cyclase domain-containing protein n=1 Tax=Marinivivus vitaminiproducens TaxID=3035935 RepID=UPI00279F5707|nr:adenylate/guanylate cyclase domain-containing protein [Geminicoccaceae bacterium SCSIO 64248]